MKSKTSLFNRTIIRNLLQRYWVLFAAYLSVMGTFLLIPLLNSLQEIGWSYPSAPEHSATFFDFVQYSTSSILVISFLAAPIVAAMLFSYLYNSRHTGMMASLPISRESMFASVSAAGLIGMTLCNLAVLLLALVLELVYGDVSLVGLGIIFAEMTLSLLVFYGIAVFCCMLTGNIFAGPAVYLIFNFLTVGAESLIHNLLQDIVFGLGRNYSPKTMFLSPILQLVESVNLDVDIVRDSADNIISYTWVMRGMGVLTIYALVGLVFLALGLRLYQNRRMEVAGDTIAIEILKPVFRLCMAVGGGLLFASFIKETLYHVTPTDTMAAIYTAVLLSVGGILGYFIAQMLITKSVNVFRRGWKSVGLYVLCVAALMTAVECDLFGYEKHVPDADEVTDVYVTVFDGYNTVTFEEPENIKTVVQLHRNIVTNKSFHEIEIGGAGSALPLDETDPAAAFRKQSVQISYTLKNGDILTRRYSISYDPDAIRSNASEIRVLEAVLNTDEAISQRCIAPFPVSAANIDGGWVDWVDAETHEHQSYGDFSPSDLAKLYNECILPDIADGRLGVYNIIENEAYAKGKYNCTISMDLVKNVIINPNGSRTYSDYFHGVYYVTTDASRTLAFLAERGITPAVIYDDALYDGYGYTDLGRYRLDGDDQASEGYYEKTTEASSHAVIGGADGPTAVFVTGG